MTRGSSSLRFNLHVLWQTVCLPVSLSCLMAGVHPQAMLCNRLVRRTSYHQGRRRATDNWSAHMNTRAASHQHH